jgi:hypothetical protein
MGKMKEEMANMKAEKLQLLRRVAMSEEDAVRLQQEK